MKYLNDLEIRCILTFEKPVVLNWWGRETHSKAEQTGVRGVDREGWEQKAID